MKQQSKGNNRLTKCKHNLVIVAVLLDPEI
jgi:hypothetical protein